MESATRRLLATGLVLLLSAGGCALGDRPLDADLDTGKPSGLAQRLGSVKAIGQPGRLLPWRETPQVGDSPVQHAVAGLSGPDGSEVRQASGTLIEAPFRALSSGIKSGAEMVSGAFSSPVEEAKDPTALANKTEPNCQLHLAMARLDEQAGRVDKAEQRYREAMKLDPRNLAVLVSYARMKDRQGRLDEAIELYRQAASAHPENAMVHNDLGLCFARRKRMDEALASLEKAVQLDAKQTLYRNNIATVLVEMGNVDAAYTHLAAVHSQAIAYYNIGYLLYKKGQPQAAAALFAQALKVDPSLRQAQAWLSRLDGGSPADPRAPSRGVASGRLEDPSVAAPDLRAVRRQAAVPGRRPPTVYTPRSIPPADGPIPRITSPQATMRAPSPNSMRQLPPVMQSTRPPGAIVPQSYEDAPLPSEPGEAVAEPAAEETTEPAADETAEPAADETTEPAADETAEPAPPAPLPDDFGAAASPIPTETSEADGDDATAEASPQG